MKFIHVSDTHLGCEIPIEYRAVRKQDFINAFKQVVDFAIKERVDFIIHSGDFFDDYFRISSDILEQVIDLLVQLKQKNIPLILIRGNHDVKGYRQKIIDLLKKLDLVKEANFKDPIMIKDISIYGVSEPANISGDSLTAFYKKVFSVIKPEKSSFNIFMFHGAPDIFNFSNDPRILSLTLFPEGFDYYALGHFHQHRLEKIENKVFALPGSTERTEISRREEKDQKGFYLVTDSSIKFIPIKVRKISVYEYKIRSEEDLKTLTNFLLSKNKETIIKIKLDVQEAFKDLVVKRLESFKEEGYLLLYEITTGESFEEIINIEINDEQIFSNNFSFVSNEDAKKIFEILKSLVDEYYTGRQTDIEKIRDLARKHLIENEA